MVCLNKLSTEALVAGLQNKREEAFSFLYDNYAAALWSVALKITKNEVIAEDVLQEVFVKIWRHIHRYDATKGTLFTWMLNITRNTCKDYFRSNQYQLSLMQDNLMDKHHQIESHQNRRQEQSADLLIFTQQLEEKYRILIELVYIHGYSQEEVSVQLQMPVGTVKTRCREALIRLRRIYSYI
jgi:RNA polymerase sigma factor (sigma-70 family)